jgi:regulator-associated protein of mTOR
MAGHPGMGGPASFIPTLMDPNPFHQMPPNQQQAPPSVFEDRQRLELDLFCMDMLVKGTKDASVLVRYEAVMGLAGAVGKYLEAFVAVASEGFVTEQQVASNRFLGLDDMTMDRFKKAWAVLHTMQKEEFFPVILKAASDIVRVVNENLLRLRSETERMSEGNSLLGSHVASPLTGIAEDTKTALPSSAGKLSSPRRKSGLRRVRSELGSLPDNASLEGEDSLAVSLHRTLPSSANHGNADTMTYTLPKSEYFQWKTSSFDHNFQASEDDSPEMDPLSPSGKAKLYQDRRNFTVKENARQMAQRYASLAPKPPKAVKRGIDLILEEDDEKAALAAEEESSAKKRELELNQFLMLRNDGAKMTSMLSFHPYEDYLVSCDGSHTVASWDTNTGQRLTSFKNGNAEGSRMTTSCWINATSQSLFLVGSDEGAVRLWGGLARDPGAEASSPSLVSAFHALPMIEGQRPSGLVCEWQPVNGKLVAAGSSKYLRSWDVESEQLSLEIETNTDAHITTLTTAWEYDPADPGTEPQGSAGVGPDIVVAGLSDGALRIFDIRTNRSVHEIGGKGSKRHGPRATQYSEHKSWVVATAFTNYSNKYEVVSGTIAGDIKAWDLRMSSSIRTIEAQRRTMTALAVHPKIPIMAAGSHAQFIKILTPDGDTLQVLRYHEKMANHRIGPVSCVAFHPFKLMFAAGATDSFIGIYAPKKKIF